MKENKIVMGWYRHPDEKTKKKIKKILVAVGREYNLTSADQSWVGYNVVYTGKSLFNLHICAGAIKRFHKAKLWTYANGGIKILLCPDCKRVSGHGSFYYEYDGT